MGTLTGWLKTPPTSTTKSSSSTRSTRSSVVTPTCNGSRNQLTNIVKPVVLLPLVRNPEVSDTVTASPKPSVALVIKRGRDATPSNSTARDKLFPKLVEKIKQL